MKSINLEKGQVMMTLVVFFLFASIVVVFGIVTPILKQVSASKNLVYSKDSYFVSNSAVEDAYYRLVKNKNLGSTVVLTLNNFTATTTITNTASGKDIISSSNANNDFRKVKASVTLGTGVSFHYGIQTGQGGFLMQNSSSVTGNIYSGGTVVGSGGNMVYGDVVSAGSSGWVYGTHATGTIYAHIIGKVGTPTTADKDAYYQTITNTTVGGTSHPGSADQPTADMPISDSQITEWENDASAGGTAICSGGTYSVSGSSQVTIGPIKIPCNLSISNSAQVTIAGHVWVTGTITVSNSAIVKMAAALGSQNVAIIADKTSDRANSSTITVSNSASFQNSGTAGSFVFLISMNNSAESGGGVNAINLSNSASALVAYAPHGLIPLANSVSLKEVTAYKITMQNSANVIYDKGLPSVVFQSGPSGGYDIGTWMEVQ